MSRTAWTFIALCMVTVMTSATPVRADVVLDWNAHAARAIVTVGGQVPPRALIRLAMVHLAIYDAVNAIEGGPFESYASVPNVDRPASAEAAAAPSPIARAAARPPRRREPRRTLRSRPPS